MTFIRPFGKLNLRSCLLAILVSPTVFSQNLESPQKARIKTNIQLTDGVVEIHYDISKSKKIERFDVWVEVTDSNGNPINAQKFEGHFGELQRGGKDKLIKWDYKSDGLVLHEMVDVQLKAVVSIADGAVYPGNALLRSIVLPGWGLSTIDRGKPYMLLGVAGYATLGASVILQLNADQYYDKYKFAFDPDLSEEYFDKSQKKAENAATLKYTAIGIWVASGLWTLIKANNINNSLAYLNGEKKVNFYSRYDPITNVLGISVIYNFNRNL